ncbi:carbohydrate ABC transporter permease [Streptomyces sp. NPDC003247]|uniref:carbohydrate ABC transporter permease n=1 Tax=Streptomyces sp. NPDC003247 TaxID=3364677 RepID=UPI0036A68212
MSTIATPPRTRRGVYALSTGVLLIGALYCLVPVAWVVVASTKSPGQLFSTFTFTPGTGLMANIRSLMTHNSGEFGRWALNSFLYAGIGSVLSVLVSVAAGYGLAKFDFPGRRIIFYAILAGVLVPGIVIAIPQYMLMSLIGLGNTYWSVLLPVIISPFGIYLCRVFAASSVPSDTLESARMDGAGEFRIFVSIALPMMVPAMVTVFMLQFVGVWNNFLLPYIMLSDTDKFPLTLGLYSLLSQSSGEPSLYSLAISGAMLSIIPCVLLLLFLQRYWRLDLISGALKG